MKPLEVRTEHLLLRQWREEDVEPFAALNADPEVMEHFPSVQGRDATEAFLARMRSTWAERGWGLWAAEVVTPGDLGGPTGFAGFVGLNPVPDFVPPGPDGPAVAEVGWRLARRFWGRGYAPEGGRAALRAAFEELQLPEVVSFTTTRNDRSRRVMEKLGLTHDPGRDFVHPLVGDWDGAPHVLYRIDRATWLTRRAAGATG